MVVGHTPQHPLATLRGKQKRRGRVGYAKLVMVLLYFCGYAFLNRLCFIVVILCYCSKLPILPNFSFPDVLKNSLFY